ncbi:MAG: alpha/beta hydrolase [Bacteroides sp.]|uniref:alpha/beta hydrolase n=1 Tax=Bacteroides sp. TaxID=29523 RepID=UPI002FC79915
MVQTREIERGICPTAVTIYSPAANHDRHIALLYFHGGGLLYGTRNDLPILYTEMLLSAGYTLYCFDYPLAPEATIMQIHENVIEEWRWFIEKEMNEGSLDEYLLFGRSAGAYLALLLGRSIQNEMNAPQPKGIFVFYGFFDLTQPFFSEPIAPYSELPVIKKELVDKIVKSSFLTNAPKELRFSLYVYARQQGTWLQLLGLSVEDSMHFSLSAEDIAALPPLFITASTGDEEIPFSESKRLWRASHKAVIKPVYHLAHDFDRETANHIGQDIYQYALAWANQLP